MNQIKQIVQIVGHVHAADNFEGDLPLHFGAFQVGDVFHRSFVGHHVARFIADHTSVFGNPNFCPILSAQLILEPLDRSVGEHPAAEFQTRLWVGVKISADVAPASDHFRRRRVSAHASQRRIHTQEFAIHRSLKDAFDRIFKEQPKALLGFPSARFRMQPLRDVFIHRKTSGAFAVHDKRHRDNLDIHQRSVAASPPGVGPHGYAGRGGLTEGKRFGLQILRSQKYIKILADNFGLAIFEYVLKSGIAHADAALKVHDHDGDRIVLHDRAQRSGLLRNLSFSGQPRGDVHRGDQHRLAVAKTDSLRGDLDIKNLSVLPTVLPDPKRRNGQRIFAQNFHQPRHVLRRADVGDFHSEEFFSRVSVVFYCGFIDVEIFERLAVEDEHWVGMVGKKKSEICIGVQREGNDVVAGNRDGPA